MFVGAVRNVRRSRFLLVSPIHCYFFTPSTLCTVLPPTWVEIDWSPIFCSKLKIYILYEISFQVKISYEISVKTELDISNTHFPRPTTRTTKTISSASDSLRSSILTSNERGLRENGDVFTYVNFQQEILNCELVKLFLLNHVHRRGSTISNLKFDHRLRLAKGRMLHRAHFSSHQHWKTPTRLASLN